jgi:alanine racemase
VTVPRERAVARVNLAAIERNVERLRAATGAGVALCAVVKASGYGHGAVPAARAALAGGATWLAVATAREAAEVRAAGLDVPLLVLGALTADELAIALDARAEVVAWREGFVAAIDRPARVHVKLDTGMGRLGTRDADEATRVADAVAAAPHLELAAAMTHFATADEPGDDFMPAQLERFVAWAQPLRERHPGILLHAANSAATLRDPATHFDLVRTGIAIYGLDPFQRDPADHGLEPALELCSYVAEVKPVAQGESAGYGRRFVAEHPTTLATIPVGYGDGVRRTLTNDADVLVGGRRLPLRGTVSMDNVTVDLGADGAGVARGDEAVLIGTRGGERILAEDWAARLQTINYEVACAIAARVPRAYHRDGVPA